MAKILILYFLVLLSMPCYSTDKKSISDTESKKMFKKTLKLINKGQIRHAEANLLELLKTDSNNLEYNYELALLYFYDLKKSDLAHKYFYKVSQIVSNSEDYPELHYYLGKTYHFNEYFDQAINEYEKSDEEDINRNEELANKLQKEIQDCKFAKQLTYNNEVRVRNLGNRVNTVYSEFVPVPIKNDKTLLFTAKRPPVISTHYGFEGSEYFEKIYLASKNGRNFNFAEESFRFPEFALIDSKRKKHNAIVGFNRDETEMLIYKKNKLWISLLKEGVWQKPSKIKKQVNFSYYQPHVSITADGKTMYFSSLSKKGFGKLDIYFCTKNENGNWGRPQNIGNLINTSSNEDSPEISPDGKTLYFSSQGHPGVGGFDIYKSKFYNNQWNLPENMGIPVNSPGDDIFFRFSKDSTLAYYSSYRKGGMGNLDIYEAEFFPVFKRCSQKDSNMIFAEKIIDIQLPQPIHSGKEVVLSIKNKQSDIYNIKNASWKIENSIFNNTPDVKYLFKNTGEYAILIEADIASNETMQPETFCVSKTIRVEEYQPILASTDTNTQATSLNNETKNDLLSQNTTTTNTNINTDTNTNVNTNNNTNSNNTNTSNNTSNTQTQNASNTSTNNDNIKYVANSLENIYFDFDSYVLRPDAIKTLQSHIDKINKNESYKITIAAHTDSRGSSQYNLILSQKRAKAVYNYLITNNVSKSKIIEYTGKGENELLQGETIKNLSAIQIHQLNRRAEVRLME